MSANHLPVCVLDAETRSALELGRGGTNAVVYAQHPTTDLWLLRFAFDDDPETIYAWQPGDPVPQRIMDHVATGGGVVSAHNAGFEHAIWNHLLTPRYGWPALPLVQLDDTAARGARCGLPRSLENMAKALGLEQQKDKAGAARMKRMAKPRKKTPGGDSALAIQDPRTYTYHDGVLYEWWNVPERVTDLGLYCDQDVRTQMALHLLLPLLPDQEWRIWQATMRANIRGVRLDVPFIRKARQMVDAKLADYGHMLHRITDGLVSSHTQVAKMKDWIATQGIQLDSLDKNVVAEMLEDARTPGHVKAVVRVRAEAGKSSVAKYPAMALHVDAAGLAYETLVYYGATATGRWSGAGWQVQNLPSRGAVGWQMAEWYVHHLLGHSPRDTQEMMDLLEDGSSIEVLSMCLRSAIRAREGYDIVCADYSNIEGRFGAWLGGELWKLAAFRAFDDGTGHDLYKIAAAGILGVTPEDVTKALRNALGKVSELALQFQGGVGAFLAMAKVYRVEIADYWGIIQESLPAHIIAEAHDAWDTFGKRSGIDRITWLAAEAVKRAWREKHPGIVQTWRDCEDAAIQAIRNPNTPVTICEGKLSFLARTIMGRPFLLMRLPSGRCIYYANVALRDKKTPWGAVKPQVVFDKVEGGRVVRSSTYGGDMFQSAVQGGARDIMAQGWLNVEEAGYLPLFSVHDELASEYAEGQAKLKEYERLLCHQDEWAQDIPITAEGYIAKRFRKDG